MSLGYQLPTPVEHMLHGPVSRCSHELTMPSSQGTAQISFYFCHPLETAEASEQQLYTVNCRARMIRMPIIPSQMLVCKYQR